ncbi:hypothetical protein PRZ48_000355 [Zasmidium cellare]|uniref:DNA-binding protein RAP1 n=1 Tax=Zasmidium cellare TaxID=395010 RepID=A0ABR0EZW0_ZASCE|nr:hypothetical protein PRZ48_000355 [Zasmidium cellare]
MANPPVVVTGSNAQTPQVGQIFDDIKFFLVQRMPSRSRFVRDIEANGGRVVKIESQADYVIADHMRKDAPAGSYSYTLIDVALKEGQLPNSSEHAIRPPGDVREVGSTTMAKGTRRAFTIEDDQFLWNWVETAKAEGDFLKGNEIYKRLEKVNSRHTHQSWRDRYIKHLSVRPPAGVKVSANPPPSPPIAEDNAVSPAPEPRPFGDLEFEKLMGNASDIERIPAKTWQEAWEAFASAEKDTPHSAEEWASYYQLEVRPKYLQLMAEEEEEEGEERQEPIETNRTDVDQKQGKTPKKRKQDADEQLDPRDRTKKQKTATPETNGNSNPQPAQNKPSGDTATTKRSDTMRHQASQALDLVANGNAIMSEPIITSDLNEAANMQLQQEADANGVDGMPPPQSDEALFHDIQTQQSEVEMPTSDANRAAEAQFGDWRASDDHGRGRQAYVEDEREESLSDEPTPRPPPAAPMALTAQNLASQQAQHEPPITRGTDLPKDDDDADQTNFAEYLSSIVGVKGGQDVPTESRPANSIQKGVNGAVSGGQAAPDQTPTRRTAHLPLSSPQEIDDALEAGLNWPASPLQRRRRDVDPEQSAEPTVVYPQLPSQQGESSSQIDDAIEEPAEALMSQLNRPTSSDRRGSGSQVDFERIFRDDDVQVEEGQSQSQEDEYNEGHEEDDDYDKLDLSMLEPDFQPSPNRQQAQPDGRNGDQEGVPRAHSVVEISSHVSTSEYSESSRGSPQPWSREPTNGKSGHAVDTQDILNAETQKPDLGLPMPMSSDDEVDEKFTVRSQDMPGRDKGKSKAVELEVLDTPEQVNDWVSTMVVRGYKKNAVVKALKCTSMRPDLALLVLIEQKAGKGIPSDVPGVWTQHEDTLLESGDAQGLAELGEKHGWEELDARFKFLDNWRTLS